MAKLHTICTPRSARFRFVQDDSSHWYAIPADKKQEFDLWVESFNCEGDTYENFIGEEFEQYRLNCHPNSYTFTNLKEDQ